MENSKSCFGIAIGGLILCLVLAGCVMFSIFGMGRNWLSGVANRVASPDAAISSYEWYEQQVKDIKAMDGQIDDAKEEVSHFEKVNGTANGWKWDQREQASRLSDNVTGLKQARRKMVEDYNARASMITRNMWRSNLPQHIEE